MSSFFVFFLFIFFSLTSFSFSHLNETNDNPQDSLTQSEGSWFSNKGWMYGVGSSMSTNPSLRFPSVHVTDMTGGTYTGSTVYYLSSGLALDLEIRKLNRFSWGFSAGITIESELSSSHGSAKIKTTDDSGQINFRDTGLKLQALGLYTNINYRWDNMYLFMGINHSKIQLTPTRGYTGSLNYQPEFGYQIGFGWYSYDNFVIEFYHRTFQFTLISSSIGGSSNWGTGKYGSQVLGVKYLF